MTDAQRGFARRAIVFGLGAAAALYGAAALAGFPGFLMAGGCILALAAVAADLESVICGGRR